MALNEDSNNTAYILGREFAVLEAIQEEANPGLNATIKDKYFNSACATPAAIFPILFKLKNSHIKKMNNGAKETYYEKMLCDLQGRLTVAEGQRAACRFGGRAEPPIARRKRLLEDQRADTRG